MELTQILRLNGSHNNFSSIESLYDLSRESVRLACSEIDVFTQEKKYSFRDIKEAAKSLYRRVSLPEIEPEIVSCSMK